jgi:NADH dehydrogenase [ubiquinone] 1 alpha subcomplex assembly factor 7
MRSRSISLKYDADNYAAVVRLIPSNFTQKTHQGWKEVLITSSSDPAAKPILRPSDDSTPPQFSNSPLTTPSHDRSPSQTRFRPVLATEPSPVSTLLGASSPRFSSLPIGARIEVSAASFRIARKLGELISQGAGGSALIIDYGTNHAVGNSFRVRVFSSSITAILPWGRLDVRVGF